MLSLLGFGADARTAQAGGFAKGRPELLRRQTVAANARLLLGASILGLPPALYVLTLSDALPFVLVMIGLAAGMGSLLLHRREQYENAVAAQVYGTLLAGTVLTLAQPGLADFGLAVALLAPILASLLARSQLKRRSWALMSLIVLCAIATSVALPTWELGAEPQVAITAGLAYGLVALMIGYSGNRLNSAFEVHEKAQIQAYQHLIEHVQDGVMRFGADGDLLFASRSSETLFGCRRFELSWGGIGERIHVADRPLFLTAFADTNQGGVARTVEVRMRREDPVARIPHFVWVEIAMSPVLDNSDTAGRHEVVALLRDITERKDQEAAMRQARQDAEEASDAKSRFLATMGHELRTPLNAIVGFSEMMTGGIGGELSATHREYAELIHQSGHHLLDVLKMLLDMSRIEAGKFELQTEGFAPEALVEPCLQMVDRLAKARKVRISADLQRGLPSIHADERACRQILINLLSNAVKFSDEGGAVTVSLRRHGNSLALSVSDSGIGMSSEVMGRLGEPFFQAQNGLARQYEGSGLGLSIVKGLVDLHGGTLSASSKPGVGTTVTVLLPINGPLTKSAETGPVTALPRLRDTTTHGDFSSSASWPDQRRNAQ